jgi:Cellulose synthase operon protein C C-terminus (BCSC_C)
VRFAASEKTNFYATASRSNVEESLLSSAGIRPVAGPFAGQLVGAVMDNRVVVGGSHGLPWKLDLFAEGGAGNRAGENVDSNFFKTASGGIGCNIVASASDQALSLVRFSYSLDYFGFANNRLGYGGASLLDQQDQPVPLSSLGGDGISPDPSSSNPGVGGYFSPERFISNTFRADLRGRPDKAFEYRLSAFVGSQSYTGASTRKAHGVSGSLVFHIGDRFSLPVTYLADNFGPFNQQTLLARLVVKF